MPKSTIAIASTIFSAEYLTHFTKGIKFTANSVSKAMDTANGGSLSHGGFHRLFGGHSIADLAMWKKYGIKFPHELFKDSLTTNGLPIPGVETLVNNNWISPSSAQKFGTFTFGTMIATSMGAVDSAVGGFQFFKNKSKYRKSLKSKAVKGSIKVVVGVIHGNLVLAVLGATDLALVAYEAVPMNVEFPEYNSFSYQS